MQQSFPEEKEMPKKIAWIKNAHHRLNKQTNKQQTVGMSPTKVVNFLLCSHEINVEKI